jgi:hypothetical protein
VRLHRDGMMPLAGRAAVARALRDRAAQIVWTPQEVRVADSGDLAVSYGKYREIARSGKAQDGFYTHLWLRDTPAAGGSPTTSRSPRNDGGIIAACPCLSETFR